MSTHIDARIRIDGDIFEIVTVKTGGYLPTVAEGFSYGKEWHVALDSAEADRATVRYYEEMSASEVICLVGEEKIVEMWTRGTTLAEWASELDAGEMWGPYNGSESEVTPPTPAERSRACLIQRLRKGEVVEDAAGHVGVREGLYTYWLVEEDGGLLDTRFLDSAEPPKSAVQGDPADVGDELSCDEIALFCEGWDALVDELGFAPTVAYRHN